MGSTSSPRTDQEQTKFNSEIQNGSLGKEGTPTEAQELKPSPFNVDHLSAPREALTVATVVFAQLLARAGLAQPIAPVNAPAETFGVANTIQTLWFPAAFSLTSGTFILVAGRIGDILGHKQLFCFGLVWYCLWSLLAGLSSFTHAVIFFDVCRAMQGIAASILTPCGLAILGSIYRPGPRKEKAFSIFAAAAPNGFVLGAVFASLLTERVSWPWAYYILAIACAGLAIVAVPTLPDLRRRDTLSSTPNHHKFDWLGCIVGVTGLILFNVAWNQAPSTGWGEPYVIVLLILGILFFATFIFVEQRVTYPLVPVSSMSGETLFVLGSIALGWSSFGIWIYYLWKFLENLRGATPLLATAEVLPGAVSGVVAALMTGFLLGRVHKPYIMVAAELAFCAGNIVVATMPVAQLYWFQTFWSALIMPFGMDLSFPVATVIMSNLVPREHQGIAASTIAATVDYSISIGLGIAGTVEVNIADGNVLRGYRGAWYSAIGLSGAGVFLAILHSWISKRKI
ncbi:MAG: hypothetical protein M1820_010189 [Bogoriella megaspora]|nr:MAG: hypothetical protein M1820_010189 [Bogoriella megaspora]